MIGEREYLKIHQSVSKRHVLFADGVKGCVLSKGTFYIDGLLKIKSVLHVKALKANLISIRQLCDQNLIVKFTKNTYKVFNKFEDCVLEGSRSFDNCFKLLQPHTCHNTSFDKIEIWHQKLVHLNYKNLTKIMNVSIVCGVPKLGKKRPEIKRYTQSVAIDYYNESTRVITHGSHGVNAS